MSDPNDRDLLAAEYVLGTLDAGDRADVASRLAADLELARAVQAWEDRLSPLAETVGDVTPPASVYEGIVRRLFGITPPVASRRDGTITALRRRLRGWQAATGGFALLAASLLAWVAVREAQRPVEGPRFTAVLQRDGAAPAMVLEIDLAARRLTIRPVALAVTPGRDYELWIIDPALGAPRSLGVLQPDRGLRESLTGYDPAVIADATYAVTVEPSGGSPTGRPSAAPILSGKLAVTPT